MKIIIIFFISFSYNVYSASECVKEIKVQEISVRSNPNPFLKVWNKISMGSIKNIQINCEMYNTIQNGDILEDTSTTVDRFRFFSGDNGVLQKKQYKVLEK